MGEYSEVDHPILTFLSHAEDFGHLGEADVTGEAGSAPRFTLCCNYPSARMAPKSSLSKIGRISTSPSPPSLPRGTRRLEFTGGLGAEWAVANGYRGVEAEWLVELASDMFPQARRAYETGMRESSLSERR